MITATASEMGLVKTVIRGTDAAPMWYRSSAPNDGEHSVRRHSDGLSDDPACHIVMKDRGQESMKGWWKNSPSMCIGRRFGLYIILAKDGFKMPALGLMAIVIAVSAMLVAVEFLSSK